MKINNKQFIYKLKPRYSDTDSYAVMHNGAYYSWFDEARAAVGELTGISMQEMAERGIKMPVIENGCKYKSPVVYGDVLDIDVKVLLCKSAKWKISYKLVNAKTKVVHATGFTVHAYMSEDNKIILSHPDWVLERIDSLAVENGEIEYFKYEK